METPRTVPAAMSAKQWNERHYIEKVLSATTHYLESKLGGFPVDVQREARGDVYRIVLTVQWVPQAPPLKIIPSLDVDGRL